MALNGAPVDDIGQRLMAAKLGEAGEQWGPHPLMRRMDNAKGEQRLQQLWVSSIGKMDWRDIPLFNNKGEYVNEGDSAINTGPLAFAGVSPAQGSAVSDVPSK